MNINRNNFKEYKNIIYKILKESDFISLDLEFSGINNLTNNLSNNSRQYKYWNLKENVKSFIPIQFGLSCFKINNNIVNAYPFNSYILPYYNDSISHNKLFTFQFNSMNFLSENNFDYNQLIYNGIYYISRKEETFLKEKINELKNKKTKIYNTKTPESSAYFKINIKKIDDYLNFKNFEQPCVIDIEYVKSRVYRYFQEEIIKLYDNKFDIEFLYDNEFLMDRTKLFVHFKEKQESVDIHKINKIEQIDENLFGFRNIIDMIIDLKIPIITHNGLIDVLQIYDKFIEPLPEDYLIFYNNFKKYFPLIYDTKYMIKTLNYDTSSNLELAFKYFKNQKSTLNFNIEDEFDNYSFSKETNKFHEAGFDSLATGYLFFRILEKMKININNVPDLKNKIKFVSNCLNSEFSLGNFNEDLEYLSSKTHVFYINLKNKKKYEFTQLYKEFVDIYGNIDYYKINNFEFIIFFKENKDSINFINNTNILDCKETNLKVNNYEFILKSYEFYIKSIN